VTAGPPTLDFDRDRLGGTRFTTIRTYAELDSTNTALVEEAVSVGSLVSFGEDARGRVYAVSLDGGVFRLVPR